MLVTEQSVAGGGVVVVVVVEDVVDPEEQVLLSSPTFASANLFAVRTLALLEVPVIPVGVLVAGRFTLGFE